LILKVGPKAFLLGEKWIPSKGLVRHFPDDRQLFLGDPWGSALRNPSWIGLHDFPIELIPPSVGTLFRPAIQLLAAIPSVIYGFWGLIVLVPLIRNHLGGPGLSILAGSLVLAS